MLLDRPNALCRRLVVAVWMSTFDPVQGLIAGGGVLGWSSAQPVTTFHAGEPPRTDALNSQQVIGAQPRTKTDPPLGNGGARRQEL